MANKVVAYLRGAKEELEKTTWPTQKEVLLYSTLTVVITVLAAAYFGLVDFALNAGLGALIGA